MIFDILLNHSHASRTVATEEIFELFNKKNAALQARCDRYEDVLISIGNGCATPQRKANEALNGNVNEIIRFHNNSDTFRYWAEKIKGYEIKLLEHQTGVRLPNGVTLESFQREWEEYERANNPKYKNR